MSDGEPVVVDGSQLEGGGQILRVAMGYSALLCKPVKVNNIRSGRDKPGLRPQHMTGLQLVRDICQGTLEGDHIGSTEITFRPGVLSQGSRTADTKTAGSIALLLQVALPCMLYADGPARAILKGGTNAEMAPQIDYITTVFQPIAERFGAKFDPKIVRRGYFPKGGGEVAVVTVPIRQLKAVELLDQGCVDKISGRSFVAGALPIKMAHEMATAAKRWISKEYKNVDIDIAVVKEPDHLSVGSGNGIVLVAETSTGCLLGGSALGRRGIPTSQVGETAAEDLLKNLKEGGCVDSHLQDQLVIFMALAAGTSRIKTGPLTLHTKTVIHVSHLLTDAKFNIIEDTSKDESCIIECEGIGLKGRYDPDSQNKCECVSPPQ